MNLIDLHCDTIWKLMMDGEGVSVRTNNGSVDMDGMRESGTMAQFFACFVYMKEFQGEGRFSKGYEHALNMIRRMEAEVRAEEGLEFAGSIAEIIKNDSAGKISAVLTVEEGGILDGRMERLSELYEKGIRLMTLTWNEKNCIGWPNSRDREEMARGLTAFGKETVERMNEMGMAVDVSHLSDGGFLDVLEISRKPVLASHSNARTLCPHPRNLSDEMIRMLAQKGGIAGLNFYPYFLNESGKAGMKDIIAHIKHMIFVGGSDFLAVGSDFDGYDEGESDLTHVRQMNELKQRMEDAGITAAQIEKIWSWNALRFLQEVWKE